MNKKLVLSLQALATFMMVILSFYVPSLLMVCFFGCLGIGLWANFKIPKASYEVNWLVVLITVIGITLCSNVDIFHLL